MNVSAAIWGVLSPLLDEALDLDPLARSGWLARVGMTRPELVVPLRRLLDAHDASQTRDVLATLPTLESTVHVVAHPGFAAGDRVGPYVLLRLLGSGGMADVWLARRDDGAFSREVALKLPLMSWLRRDLSVRFARERDILARLEHPNIARLYDAGVSAAGLPYLAMEYVDGQPLTLWCDAHRLTVPERIRLFAQVLAAMQFAHANLVIHRDLKPSNILVTADRQIRLLDFGIAKLLEGESGAPQTELTRISGRALTPLYASPEQIQSETLTIASDVYSLGVVLYELLTGTSPYRLKRDSVAQLEEAILSSDPLRPSAAVTPEAAEVRGVLPARLTRQLTGDLDTIVLKALSKAPEQRYPTVAALAEDLGRHLEGQPVHAQPPSTWYRMRKFVARHRLPVLGGAAALAAVLGVATVAVFQARKARAQELVALSEARKATAVKDFLVDILKSADPGLTAAGTPAREVTVQQAVDRAAEQIRTALADQPDARMAVLHALAGVYSSLDQSERSVAMLKEALELSRKYDGVPHENQVAFLGALANAEMFAGHSDQAMVWLQQCEAVMAAMGDTTSWWYAQMLKVRGNLERRGNNPNLPHAIQVLEQAAALFRERYAADEGRLGVLFYLAQSLRSVGEADRAAAVADEAVALANQTERPGFDLPNAYSLRAAIRESNGDLAGADSDFATASPIYHRQTGATHFLTLQNDGLHGMTLMEMGQRDRGMALVEASAEGLARGRPNSNTHASGVERVGTAAVWLGRHARAVPVLEQARAMWLERHDELQRTVATLNLAIAQLSLGHYAEARTLLDEVQAAREKREGGAANFSPAEAQLWRGWVALETDDATTARTELEKVVTASGGSTRADLTRQLGAQAGLSRLAREAGDGPAALAAADRAVAAWSTPRLKQFPVLEAMALEARGTARCRFGRAAEGEGDLARAVSLSTGAVDPVDPELARLRLEHAGCLGELGRTREAREQVRLAAEVLDAETVAPHFTRELKLAQAKL
jgi:eukaryotic-like serine/threonine-protein kinase